jgi:hypothetical protein
MFYTTKKSDKWKALKHAGPKVYTVYAIVLVD